MAGGSRARQKSRKSLVRIADDDQSVMARDREVLSNVEWVGKNEGALVVTVPLPQVSRIPQAPPRPSRGVAGARKRKGGKGVELELLFVWVTCGPALARVDPQVRRQVVEAVRTTRQAKDRKSHQRDSKTRHYGGHALNKLSRTLSSKKPLKSGESAAGLFLRRRGDVSGPCMLRAAASLRVCTKWLFRQPVRDVYIFVVGNTVHWSLEGSPNLNGALSAAYAPLVRHLSSPCVYLVALLTRTLHATERGDLFQLYNAAGRTGFRCYVKGAVLGGHTPFMLRGAVDIVEALLDERTLGDPRFVRLRLSGEPAIAITWMNQVAMRHFSAYVDQLLKVDATVELVCELANEADHAKNENKKSAAAAAVDLFFYKMRYYLGPLSFLYLGRLMDRVAILQRYPETLRQLFSELGSKLLLACQTADAKSQNCTQFRAATRQYLGKLESTLRRLDVQERGVAKPR